MDDWAAVEGEMRKASGTVARIRRRSLSAAADLSKLSTGLGLTDEQAKRLTGRYFAMPARIDTLIEQEHPHA